MAEPPQPQAPAEMPALSEDEVAKNLSNLKPLDNFKFPTPMDKLEAQGVLLAQDLDLAIRLGLTAQQVKEQVISNFPATTIFLLKQFGVEKVVEYVSEKAPPDWDIAGVAGAKMIEKLFPLL
jgi:hypothetical protein